MLSPYMFLIAKRFTLKENPSRNHLDVPDLITLDKHIAFLIYSKVHVIEKVILYN